MRRFHEKKHKSFFKSPYLPTISLSPEGKLLKVFLKSSDLDLYEGYNALYQDVFLALCTPGSSLLLQLKKKLTKKIEQLIFVNIFPKKIIPICIPA